MLATSAWDSKASYVSCGTHTTARYADDGSPCARAQVLADSKTLVDYDIRENATLTHLQVRQRTYSDVDYPSLAKFTEGEQRKRRYVRQHHMRAQLFRT